MSVKLEVVVLENPIHTKNKGRKSSFTTVSGDANSELVESIVWSGDHVRIARSGREVIVPLSKVNEMYPKSLTSDKAGS